MKQILLRTKLGHFLLEARDKLNLVYVALTKEEAVGTLSNDILSTKLITRICLPEKVFIDIGSHIGSIISEVQNYNKSISIVGVEAIPEKVSNLRKNFPKVNFFECALGDKTGTVTFYINVKESGYSSLLEPKGDSADYMKEITVPIKKLDDLAKFQNVDAIKIDVEGAELGVIKGGMDTIINNKPIIMFESAPGEIKTKEELWDVFYSLNYGIHLPNRLAHNDNPLSKACFVESHIYPRFTTNYFAVPIERRLEYRDRARKILNVKISVHDKN